MNSLGLRTSRQVKPCMRGVCMRGADTRLQAIEIGADVVAGPVQHLTPKAPVLLHPRRCFRVPAGKFPVRVGGLLHPTHG